MSHSGRAWAIESRGRIVLDRRYIHPDGVWSTGGLSVEPEVERVLHEDGLQGGPLWRRKRDAERFLWPGERVVQARVHAEVGA